MKVLVTLLLFASFTVPSLGREKTTSSQEAWREVILSMASRHQEIRAYYPDRLTRSLPEKLDDKERLRALIDRLKLQDRLVGIDRYDRSKLQDRLTRSLPENIYFDDKARFAALVDRLREAGYSLPRLTSYRGREFPVFPGKIYLSGSELSVFKL